MMYNEFINLSKMSESYISYSEYATEIEPIYVNSNCATKADFMKLFEEAFKKIVYPTVEKAIKAKSLDEKADYVFNCDSRFEDKITEIDKQARKIAYEYLNFISKI